MLSFKFKKYTKSNFVGHFDDFIILFLYICGKITKV